MKKRILSLLLVLSLLLSLLPEQVLAADTVTVYLMAEHILPESEYDFAVWAWPDGGDGVWYLPDGPADADGCIAFQIPSDRPNVIFAAFGEGSTPDWGNKIYQTEDLILDTAAPYFILTSPTAGTWSATACVHQWSSQVTLQPTCTATGTKVYTCGLCGDSYEATLAMVEHNWQNDVCADCGTVKRMVYVSWEHMFPAAEYDCYAWIWPNGGDGRWVAPSAVQEVAGYTAFPLEDDDAYVIFAFFAEGQEPVWDTQLCQTSNHSASTTWCYYTLNEYVYGNVYVTGITSTSEACGHSWSITDDNPATCTEGGYLAQSCTLCGQSATLETQPTGHSAPPEELTVVTQPTCTESGVSTYICETCQETISVTIPALGHICGEDGNCTSCGELCAVKLTQEDGTVTYYLDLYTAYNAGSGYRQIELLQDAALYSTQQSECIAIYGDDELILDLNGHTLTVSSGSYGAFYLNGGNAAVQNGTIAIAGSSTKAFDLVSGDLTLQSVAFTPAEGNDALGCYCVVNSNGSCTLYNVRTLGTIGYLLIHVSTSGSAVLNNCNTYDPSAAAGDNAVYAGPGAQLTIQGGNYQYIETTEVVSSALAEGYCYRYIDGTTYASGNEYALYNVEVAQAPLVPTVSQRYEITVGQPLTITPTYTANIEDFDSSYVTYKWNAPITNVAYTENEDGGITLTVSAAGTQHFYLTYGYKGYTKVIAIEISVSDCTDHIYNDNGICTYCGAYQPSYTQDAEGCYLIGNAADYLSFVSLVNSTQPGANAKLTADIDLTGLSVVPMGSQDVPYTGTFDGQGYTLSNVSCIGAAKYWGLFAVAQDATIQNLGVTGTVRNTYSQASTDSGTGGILAIGRGGCIIRNCWTDLTVEGGTSTAGIVAFMGAGNGGSLIENCHVKGVVRCVITDATYGNIAGIAGTYAGTIRDCTNEAQIIGLDEFSASGIAIQGAGTIENCVNKGSVSTGADGDAAGIIVDLTGLAQNCVNEGAIYAPGGYYVGGIAAQNRYITEGQEGTIQNCTNLGAVTGGKYTGGITGYADGLVQACVNLGAVTAGDDANVGGIVGYARGYEIRDCGNQGSVTGGASANVGGIVGDSIGGTVYNSYNVGTFTAGEEGYAHPIGRSSAATNCYYLTDTETEDGGRTAAQFASGQVAYALNGSVAEETSVWKQTLDTDAYPVLSGPLVYYGELCQCDGTSLGEGYSNTEPGTLPDHTYGENGLCTVCRHSNTPAELNAEGYYEIDTPAKLWWFAQQVNGGNTTINAVLTADIDLTGTCGEGIGNWTPIGNSYSGHFNGQGFTISNLYISGNEKYVGLFGYVRGATIENVTVTGSVSTTMAYDENYYAAAAGGIVAYMNDGTVRNCHVNMTVSGGNNIGGICGLMYDGLIEDCTVNGNVICNALPDQGGGFYLGGIVGGQFGGTVRGCVNRAAASAENSVYFGGIAGLGAGDAIENCLNYGTFHAIYDSTSAGGTVAGGIVGSSGTVIRNCGNFGSINISGTGECTGGIVGLHQTSSSIVENCYNVGSVTSGDGKFGFIVGFADANAITTNCYYLSGTETEDGGRTIEQFASGQVAYELNGSTTAEDNVWRQTIGEDAYPIFDGLLVYCNATKQCNGTELSVSYSNTSGDTMVHTDADGDNYCDDCGGLFITGATFPDANFRTYVSNRIDTDSDGVLSTAEITAVYFMDVAGKGITDLTGIGYFTELTTLDASNNYELRSIDVSALTKLEVLYLEGCSSLKTLDLQYNTKLAVLDIYLTGLTSLDLSHNPNAGILNGYATNTVRREHCGMGYVDMSQFGDPTRMTITSGGTLGEDGWLQLDGDMDQIIYEYDTKSAPGNMAELIVVIDIYSSSVSHKYEDQCSQKDAAGHYTRACSICRTPDESSIEACEYDNSCDTQCSVCGILREITHTYDNDCDTQCNICGEIRTITHSYANGFCTACGGYEEPELLDGVYQIANGGNLFWFAQAVNGGEGGANAVLTADIDLESRQWVPIQGYTGTFDGAGHSISGFAITEYNSATLVVGSKMYLGLFGYIESPAVVKSFTLNGRIALFEGGSTEGYLGAAVAASGQDNQHNGGTITGITSNVTLITGAGYSLSHGGGVAGALYGGSISQCIFTGSLSSNGGSFNEVGGVVGYCQDTLIENCAFYGSVSVSGSNHAGGILGYVNNSGAIIRNNVSLGSVSGGNAQYVGAIIGRANSNCAAANGYNNYYSTVNVLYGIGSGSEGMSNDTAATSMPTEAFYSGQVTWLLNEEGEGVWTQSLTGDSLPGFSGDAVYYWNVYDCAGNVLSKVYTNTPTDGTIPDHTPDENGLCSVCGQQFLASVTADGQTTYCAQLSQAIGLANEASEAVITLLTSFTPEDTLDAITSTVTLELNGKTCSADAEYLLKVSGGSLTIRDSLGGGKLLASTGSGGTVGILSGDLILESGTIEQDLDGWGFAVECLSGRFTQTGGALVSNGDALYGNSTSQISIQGGSLQGYYETFSLNADASVTLTGGSFPQGISALNSVTEEGIPLASLLAEGYAFYQEGRQVDLTEDQTSIAGSITVAQKGPISVDITWGDLSFTYSDGTWNPDTLTYDGRGWMACTDGSNVITVTNSGDESVTVSVSYIPAEGYTDIAGSFGEASATLTAEEEKKFWLLLSGKPENEISGVSLGTVTVTIGGE